MRYNIEKNNRSFEKVIPQEYQQFVKNEGIQGIKPCFVKNSSVLGYFKRPKKKDIR